MEKIILIGSGGSGKSTAARQLSDRLNIGVYHLDSLFWKPGWVAVPKAEQRETQEQLVKKERWIIDGNYGSTMDLRITAADTIIFLDMNRYLCLYRVIKRWINYRNKTRPDSGAGPERLDFAFLKWVWSYPKAKKPDILEKIEKLSDEKAVVVVKSPQELEEFISRLDESRYKLKNYNSPTVQAEKEESF